MFISIDHITLFALTIYANQTVADVIIQVAVELIQKKKRKKKKGIYVAILKIILVPLLHLNFFYIFN